MNAPRKSDTNPAKRHRGAQPANRNAMRHGLRAGKLPKDCKFLENRLNHIRRVLEDAVQAKYGMVAIEAACSGIPTIAAPTPGLLESLSWAGTFVPREDLDALAGYRREFELAPGALAGPNTRLKIGVYSRGERLETVSTVFIGPRDK